MERILDLIAMIEEDVSFMRYDSSRAHHIDDLHNSIEINTNSINEHLEEIKKILSKGV